MDLDQVFREGVCEKMLRERPTLCERERKRRCGSRKSSKDKTLRQESAEPLGGAP